MEKQEDSIEIKKREEYSEINSDNNLIIKDFNKDEINKEDKYFETNKENKYFETNKEDKHLETNKEVCLVVTGSVDSGKCFGLGTYVMKYDGKLEKVENLKSGDLLMGDDSTPRKILETHKGKGQLYKIIPVKGKEYIVNGEHILCLKYSNNEYVYYDTTRKRASAKYVILEKNLPKTKIKHFPLNGKSKESKLNEAKQFLENQKGKKLEHGDIIEISVNEFLKLKKHEQNMLKWFRTGIEFPKKENPFDAYMLGIWLGDGTLLRPEITSADEEIIKYFQERLIKYNVEIVKYKYGIRQIGGKNTHFNNEFRNLLRDYKLFNNKHIPDIYKYNSREIRLQLLAGLIDSDGYYNKGGKNSYSFIILNKYENLIDDIIWLIRSLGFTTYKYYKKSVCTNGKNGPVETDCSRFEFCGKDQEMIPCVLTRKKASKRITKKSNMLTGITIKKVEMGEYYGFSLDGNKRFLLEDFSVAHNSSFIGVITSGELDDGKGYARAKVAKHPHEIREGKTSDISTRTLNFNGNNITFVDLCGHEKYLKTTLFGITGFFPDYGILLVSANRGLLKMTKEHMGILLYMKIPFIILVTRVDITPKNIYESVLININKILKKFKREPEIINSLVELNLDNEKLKEKELESLIIVEKLAKRMKNNPFIVPIITISNKTGYYIDVVKYMFSKLESRKVWNTETLNGTIFYIDSKFSPTGIGLVVSGLTKGKSININNEMLIGPFGNEFKKIKIWSLHNNNKQIVTTLEDRQRGCLAIRSHDKKDEVSKQNIRKGMIVISKDIERNICYQFSAEIEILNHSTVISRRYTPVIHCGIVRQSARIILEEGQILKMGDKAIISFRFVKNPEFIEKDSIFSFREGTTRGVGVVKSIIPLKDDPNQEPAEQKKIEIINIKE